MLVDLMEWLVQVCSANDERKADDGCSRPKPGKIKNETDQAPLRLCVLLSVAMGVYEMGFV